MKRLSGLKRLYVTVLAVVGVALVVAGAVYLALPPASQTLLFLEVGKAAVSVIPVALFGFLIGEVVRQRDSAKATAERDQQVRREFRRRAIEAHSQTKAIRRSLRGAGLRPDSGIVLTPELLTILDDEIRALGEAQLAFERLKREMRAKTTPFRDRQAIYDGLLEYERELASVVHEWEERRPGLTPDTPATAFATWDEYARFVADRFSLSSEPSSHMYQRIENAFLREIDAVAS